MDVFKVVNFESNNIADAACKELFSKSNAKRKNKSISSGKIAKRPKKRKNKQNKQKIKNVVPPSAGINVIANQQLSKNKGKPEENSGKQIQHAKKKISKKLGKNKIENVSSKKDVQTPNANGTTTNKRQNQKNNEAFSQQLTHNKRKNRSKNKNTDTVPLQQNAKQTASSSLRDKETTHKLDYKRKKREKLTEKLQQTINTQNSKKRRQPVESLRTRMMEKLQAARFRYINEQIYCSDSKEAQKMFSSDPETFRAYHEGYRQQVNKWPLNPLDIIIESIQKLPKTHIIADFGCGDAKLARSVAQKVHSFDLVSPNESVTACDMAHVPLQSNSVDVVVFCLSLMGTNLHDYILEANRVLKEEGILKIAEVESRFEDVHQFIEGVQRFHFKHVWKDLSHNLFYFLDFKKESNIKNKKKLPTISLNACLYKKR